MTTREQLIKALHDIAASEANPMLKSQSTHLFAAADMLEADGVPVAWMHEFEDGELIPLMHKRDDRPCDRPKSVRPLIYGDTALPAQRVPLTVEQIVDAVKLAKVRCVHPEAETTIDIARAIEAAHGITENKP